MRRIGIVAALPGELKPLVRGWRRQGSLRVGQIGGTEAAAACAGMGTAAARRACDAVLSAGSVDALISVGWAGSLSCGLQAGQAYMVREIIEASTGDRFPTDSGEGQRLITLDQVADPAEKRRLASKYQAVMVDMEAATVARIARERGLAFFCFKGISDGPNDKLPDFNRFTGPDGNLRTAALLAWSAAHPAYWKPLLTLGRNSSHAAAELSARLTAWAQRPSA